MVQTVQKTVEVPQVEFVDTHVHIPVHKQRHVPMVTVSQRHVEVPVVQTVEKIVDVPVVRQVDVPHVTTIEKIVEVPHVQVVEKIEEVPVAGQTLPGRQLQTQQQLPAIRQVGQAEQVTVNEYGPPLEAVSGGQEMIVAPQPVPQPVVYEAPAPVTTIQAAPVVYEQAA